MRLLVTTLCLLVLFVPFSAGAQELSPGDACSVTDAVTRVGGPDTPNSYVMKCNGTTWQSIMNFPDTAGNLTVTGNLTVNGTCTGCGGGGGGDADTLDTLDSLQFLRADQSDTMSGNLTLDSIIFEGGDHRITNNDGNGNFNLRVGHNSSETYSDNSGAIFMDFAHENATPHLDINLSATGTAGNSVVWVETFTLSSGGQMTWTGNTLLQDNLDVTAPSAGEVARFTNSGGNSQVFIEPANANSYGMLAIDTDQSGTTNMFLIGYGSTAGQPNELSLKNSVGDITFYPGGGGSNSEVMHLDTTGVGITGNLDVSGTISGDGSGLTGISADNADTVDGLHAAAFLRSNANDEATGRIQFARSSTIAGATITNAAAFVSQNGTTGLGMDPNELYFGGLAGNIGTIGNYDLAFNVGGGDITFGGANLNNAGAITATGATIAGHSYDNNAGHMLLTPASGGYIDFRPSNSTHGFIIRDHTGGSTAYGGIRTTSAGTLQLRADGASYNQLQLYDSGNISASGTITAAAFSGDGSGLTGISADDADTLDGINSTSFWRRDTSNSADIRFASGNGRGMRFWDSDNYKIWMSSTADATWGGRLDGTSDYNMYFRMSGGTDRGFVFQNGTTEVFHINPNSRLYGRPDATMPSLVLDSTSSGDTWTDQGAFISIGESGELGAAAMHMTYRGDGYGFIGSGAVANAEPGASYLRFDYDSDNIYTPDTITAGNFNCSNCIGSGDLAANAVGNAQLTDTPTFTDVYIDDSNTRIHQGGGNAVRIQTNSGYIDIGPQNTTWAHINTDRNDFYFNKNIAINGTYRAYNGGSTVTVINANGTIPAARISGKVGDADTLDGVNSSSFLRSDADDIVSAHTEWQDNMNVRLGTSADFRMYHSGTDTYFRSYLHGSRWLLQGENGAGTNRAMIYADPDNYVQLFYAGSEKMRTSSIGIDMLDGDVHNVRYVRYDSDERKKKNIVRIDSALEKIGQLKGVSYLWKDEFASELSKGKTHIGLIAQDVEAVFPELVTTDEDGYKDVVYAHLIAPVIEAIKELWDNVKIGHDAQQAEIEALKTQNAALLERLDSMEKRLNALGQ